MVRFSDLKQAPPGSGGRRANSSGDDAGNAADVQPAGDTAARFADSLAERTDIYEDASFYLSKVFHAVKEGKPFALDPGFRIMRQVVEAYSPQDTLFVKAIQLDDRLNYLINKCINVAIYSVRLAEQLGYPGESQVEIGMAGLLHEVGMCRIPDEILYKKERLTRSEFETIQKHSEFGYEMLKPFGSSHPYLAEVALQVHERIDGSGYPRGLKGDEIHEYAQIVGLVDIYEALSHSRPQRDRFNHFYAIKEIIKTCKPKFHKMHLKALLNAFSIFPLSTYVRLNSNAVGRVIETYPDQPMRPRLQIEYDSQERKVLTERVVNLPENSLLYIVDSVSEEEMDRLEAGVGLQAPPKAFEKRSTSEDFEEAAPAPAEKAAPPPADKNGKRGGRGRKGPLLGLLLVLALFFGSIPYWHGRQPVSPSSASGAAGKDLPETDRETPARLLEHPAGARKTRTAGLEPGSRPAAERQKRPPSSATADRAPYSVLLSSFRRLTMAERALALYRGKGIDAYRVRVDLGDYGVWHRVFCGRYRTFQEAAEAAAKLPTSEAVVKHTRYGALVGSYSGEQQASADLERLQDLGYSPYLVRRPGRGPDVFVGAFYTRKGAADKAAELLAKGVESRAVER